MTASQTLIDYSTKPDEYYSHARTEMTQFIPKTIKRMLDVGCSSGAFGAQFKHNLQAEVWGVEYDPKVAELAKAKLDKVLPGDIIEIVDDLPNAYFDCITFNDVLEHLVDPYKVLTLMKDKLTPNGIIVCSIPNIRWFYALKSILLDKQWKYEDGGIFDRTHLRFFTQKSIIDMFNSLDFKILRMQGINELSSWKFDLFNILFLGHFSDSRYMQFACVVTPK
jgi:2-polyprenyl-3-methyl-5-hydroxy-6-metoxy-1,4-benzoquinol methylase